MYIHNSYKFRILEVNIYTLLAQVCFLLSSYSICKAVRVAGIRVVNKLTYPNASRQPRGRLQVEC